MQFKFYNIYCFVSDYNISDLKKLSKNINIIYRNYKKNNISDIIKLKSFCKKFNHKFFISNNFKLSLQLDLDGVYVPAFNRQINYCGLFPHKKTFKIVGSAHNTQELIIKQKQSCSEIFISPLFKVQKSLKFLDTVKFNLLTLNNIVPTIALGGINKDNFKILKMLNISGFGSIGWAKKNGLKLNQAVFLKVFLR